MTESTSDHNPIESEAECQRRLRRESQRERRLREDSIDREHRRRQDAAARRVSRSLLSDEQTVSRDDRHAPSYQFVYQACGLRRADLPVSLLIYLTLTYVSYAFVFSPPLPRWRQLYSLVPTLSSDLIFQHKLQIFAAKILNLAPFTGPCSTIANGQQFAKMI
jgi:hypothetical protein